MSYPVIPTVPIAGGQSTVITKFILLQAQAIAAGTPVDVYTPTAGKRFTILAYHVGVTIASSLKFEDGTGNVVLTTPVMAAATPVESPPMGNGIVSAVANTHLFLDATVTTNVSGWIGIAES